MYDDKHSQISPRSIQTGDLIKPDWKAAKKANTAVSLSIQEFADLADFALAVSIWYCSRVAIALPVIIKSKLPP